MKPYRHLVSTVPRIPMAKPSPDFSDARITLRTPPAWIYRAVLPLIFGAAFILVMQIQEGGWQAIVGLVLLLISLPFLIWFAWRLRPRTITMDNSVVRVTERLPFVRGWEEPVSAFTCVKFRKGGFTGRSYAAVLVHSDDRKSLGLAAGTNEGDVRKVQEHVAGVLNLPAIDE